jgi:DNA repair protein RadA/Sms
VVCYIEGERYSTLRIVHCVKNRFGATDEVGLLEMTEKGFVPASRSSLFSRESVPGIAVTAVSMGNRPFALEVQALIAPTYFPAPRRVVTGCGYNRTLMLLAVLEKRLNMPIGKMDAYVNLVGGISTEEPALDLAVSIAVASSFLDKSVPQHTAFVGEVGLTGEIRPVAQISSRLKELASLGIKTVVCPMQDFPKVDGLDIVSVSDLVNALKLVWPAQGRP